jgi:3-oxoacyl-[acyl-carrier-protein] synthase II
VHTDKFVDRNGRTIAPGYSGKLSMGVGGINSCVISRPWDE